MATSSTTITGNLTRDPILKKFEGTGAELVRLRVAVNRRVLKDEKWVDGDAMFISVEAWGSLARHCKLSLGVGMPVIVTGHLVNSEWQVPGEEKPRVQNVLKASSIGVDLTFYITAARKMDPNERRIAGLQVPDTVIDDSIYDETVAPKEQAPPVNVTSYTTEIPAGAPAGLPEQGQTHPQDAQAPF